MSSKCVCSVAAMALRMLLMLIRPAITAAMIYGIGTSKIYNKQND
jgi:hypothetical protein